MNVIEMENGPNPAAVRLASEPLKIRDVAREFCVAEDPRLGEARQCEKIRERMAVPKEKCIEAVRGQFVQVSDHQGPIEEPREILGSDGPIVGSAFHPEKISPAYAKRRFVFDADAPRELIFRAR